MQAAGKTINQVGLLYIADFGRLFCPSSQYQNRINFKIIP